MITTKPRVEDGFGMTLAPLSVEEIYVKQIILLMVLMSGMVRNQIFLDPPKSPLKRGTLTLVVCKRHFDG